MDYELSDSSGTDDDLPPSHQNRFSRGALASRNGRSGVLGSAPFPRMQGDMEAQIHHIEQEAYSAVLRAFKAQSDAITWEKESLITELRKELRVSDEEHRELLSRVNADDVIRRIRCFNTAIREWRKGGGLQPGIAAQPMHDPMPSPTVSASRKKQKTSQSIASLSLGAPSPALHPTMQPSSSALKRGPSSGSKSKKTKPYPSAGLTGRSQVANRGSSGAFMGNEAAEGATYDPLIGRKVWTRWPEDNHFYEAVITDYNPVEGRHALVYDINTINETWEWVNLKEISPEDIRWEGNEPGMSHRGSRPGAGRGMKKSMARGGAVPGAGRGRGGTPKAQPKRDYPPLLNGPDTDDFEIYNTDSLIKEVERVFGAAQPDPTALQEVTKLLKEQEQALVNLIAKLDDTSDGESEQAAAQQYNEVGIDHGEVRVDEGPGPGPEKPSTKDNSKAPSDDQQDDCHGI